MRICCGFHRIKRKKSAAASAASASAASSAKGVSSAEGVSDNQGASDAEIPAEQHTGLGMIRWALLITMLLMLTGCESGCSLLPGGSGKFVNTGSFGNSENVMPDESVTIMAYNVQNIFDGSYDGDEYDQFDPRNSSWNNTKYHQRLARLRDTIFSVEGGVPDILLFVEIEGEEVLKDLFEGYLKNSGLSYYAATDKPGSAIETGIMSRFPLDDIYLHSGEYNGMETPRPIMESVLLLGDEKLHILVSHWKSKLGGAEETEAQRMAAAAAIGKRVRSIKSDNPDALVLAAGDFNESPDEQSKISAAYPTALMPLNQVIKEKIDNIPSDEDSPADSGGFTAGMLYLTGEPGETDVKNGIYFSPWLDDIPEEPEGSYVYRGEWERIDQFLLCSGFFDEQGLEFDRFIVHADGLTDETEGYPLRWNVRTGGGFSDHLPILLELDTGR